MSASTAAGASGILVVRARGEWTIYEPPYETGRVATADAVAALSSPGATWSIRLGQPGSAPPPRTGTALTASTGLIPTRAVVGCVGPGGVGVESLHGLMVTLDAADLRLVEVIGSGAGYGALPAMTGASDEALRASVGRLVEAGFLTVAPAGAQPEAADLRPAAAADLTPPAAGEPAAIDANDEVPGVVLRGAPGPSDPSRVPVYAPWHLDVGPLLSLGMLTAFARTYRSGALTETYEIRRPETADSVLADLARRSGPAVLLCSDYVWSIDANLDLARRAAALCPQLIVIHGGPSSPQYEDDAATFLRTHRTAAHVLVRGEGEECLAEVLEAMAADLDGFDGECLADVAGVTYWDVATDAPVRTPDRARIVDLDALPSPYLTGEFDHIPPEAWFYCLAVESNRGCPYGCTFCDWGSATMSRIRKFDLDRVTAEIEWAAERQTISLNVPDANFGILRRDVEITKRIAEVKARTGFPQVLVFYPAKNSTRHLVEIMDILNSAGIASAASLSLQTTDPLTLDVIDRSNISTGHFVELAADYRRRGHPLQGDLLIGLPGQTYESYRADLQFMADHEILVRTWPVQLLPNSPMNAPEYRREHGIRADDRGLIMETSTFTPEDRSRMLRLRRIDITFERYGLLRHVMRWLQWDHGIAATEVMQRLLDLVESKRDDFPLLRWVATNFDIAPAVPVGWFAFFGEVRRFLVDELGVPPSPMLDTVLTLQQFLLPARHREFPATILLAHDYVAYYRANTDRLYTDGRADPSGRLLSEFGPAEFTIQGDPLELCAEGLDVGGDSRSETMQGDFYIGSSVANELWSPLTRLLPWVAAKGFAPLDDRVTVGRTSVGVDAGFVDEQFGHQGTDAWRDDTAADAFVDSAAAEPVPVQIGRIRDVVR